MSAGKLIAGFVGVAFALAGPAACFYAGVRWEDRPADWPNYQIHAGPLHWTLRFPDGPAARLAALQAAGKAQAAHVQAVEVRQAQVSAQAAQRETQAQAENVTRYRTITREVPIYVTPSIDRGYPLPWGLVRLHDAAALGVPAGSLSNPASQSDDEPASVEASDLTAVIVGNYGAAKSCAVQLTGLQQWVRDEQAATATISK